MRRRAILLSFALTACAASDTPAKTHVEQDGVFVAECPGNPDACVKAANEHCPDIGYILDGGILVTRRVEPYARRSAESGYLRLRCVGTMMDTRR